MPERFWAVCLHGDSLVCHLTKIIYESLPSRGFILTTWTCVSDSTSSFSSETVWYKPNLLAEILDTIFRDHLCIGYQNWYHQMGELWTLLEFPCSLYLTCNMVLDMDGSLSSVLLYIMIFSILELYGIKFWYELQGKILLAIVTPAFGVILDSMGKVWTNSSSASANNLE